MKHPATLLLLLVLSAWRPLGAAAQTEPVTATATTVAAVVPDSLWKKSFTTALNFQETTLSSNWRGGGVNSLGLNASLNAKADYQQGIHSWDNQADLLYAFVSNKGQGYRKSLDRIYLDTKYGRALNPKWDMFVSLNLLTQFAPGYKYSDDGNGQQRAQLVSSTFAPAFLTAAYGFEYHPTSYFKLRLSPFAPRLTVVNRPERFVAALGATPYGVRPGHSTRFEVLAAQALAEFDKDIATNMNLKARYLLFANYGSDFALRRIDHRLDAGLTAKVNRYINVALTGILLYDYDQDKAVQYSQGLTLGLVYSVQNFKERK
ncbi:DUF3078 domain-containing protein [Hymenobacter actinosclerus]|uniref:DUF3078 domain-containing protein n=1 Tax=Hymenobacter actinosclerus TaxID=82805 RepID=A0A1I0EUL2_9BACT|nr:DUF3078 domain-containing protein [Hymenobacter actinosclerus]SET49134.1 Protein of unknown function [Hymenobacter actinosclerus]